MTFKTAALFVKRVLRDFKPVRTFWQALSALLAVYAVGEGTGLETVNWESALSASALAALISFVTLMAAGDSLWSTSDGEN